VESQEIKTDSRLLEPKQMAQSLITSLQQSKFKGSESSQWYDFVVPIDIWESLQLSKTAYMNVKVSGDPRLENGRSTLQVAEDRIDNPNFVPYQTFKGSIAPHQEVNTGQGDVTPIRLPKEIPREERDRFLSALSPRQLTRVKEAFGPSLNGIQLAKWLASPLHRSYDSTSKLSQLESFGLWRDLREELGIIPKLTHKSSIIDNDRRFKR